MNKNTGSLQEWADLIEPIPKMAVPLEFVKQIIFHYNDNEIVLDTQTISNSFTDKGLNEEFANALENWIALNRSSAEKISMVVDVEKVKAFIEPITEKYLNKYFGQTD